MSLSVNREGADGFIEWCVSIAGTYTFNTCWDPAIRELGIHYFQENGCFGYSQLQDVLHELDQIKDWVREHLDTEDAEIVIKKVEQLKIAIPKAFVGHEDAKLYIY